MSDFYEDNEIDDIFRRGFEGQEIKPPTSVWENVKNVALERQLISAQSANFWLKGLSGLLTVALGSVGYLYWQKTQNPTLLTAPPTQIVTTITKNDTVFIDRPVTVYVRVPTPTQANQEALAQNTDETSMQNTDESFAQNIDAQDNTATTGNDSKNDSKDSGLDTNNEASSDVANPKNIRTKGKTNKNETGLLTKNSKSSAKYLVNNQTPSNEQTQMDKNNRSDSRNFEPSNASNSDAKITENAMNEAISQRANSVSNLTLALLSPLPFMAEYMAVASPEFEYTNRFKPSIHRRRGVNMEWLSGTSIIGYTSYNDKSNLIQLRDSEDAFSISQQEPKSSTTWGIRAETKISKKLAIAVGYQHTQLTLEQNNPKYDKSIDLEYHRGSQEYLLKTPTGVATISTAEFGPARRDDRFSINQKISQSMDIAQIPLSIRYAFWQKRWQMYSLAVYGLGGVNLLIPYNQTANVSFRFNNKNYQRTLKNFDNMQRAWGLQAALGVEVGYGYHAKIFIEPSLNQSAKSIVKEMPVRTLVNNRGVRVGMKWSFGK